MKIIIYKYQLKFGVVNEFRWPKGSEILCFRLQLEEPTIWVRHPLEGIETKDLLHLQKVVIFGTGQGFLNADLLEYVGTAINTDHSLVWHCFKTKIQ